MRRNMLDNAWNDLMNKVKYKAETIGKNFEQIDPAYTSKTCNKCGYIKKDLKLSDRNWICPECNTNHDRDLNAANNIRDKFFNKK
jgi:putative transposase